MSEPFTILMVDDNQLARMGVAMLISTQEDMRLVGQAPDGATGVKMFGELMPDVSLIDLRLPGMDGIAVLQEIKRRFPRARCLVLSHYDGDENIFRALRAGASGYLTKEASGPTILEALRAVHAGQRYLPPAIAAQLADHLSQAELTKREQDVLEHIARGGSNRDVAAALAISDRTVATYVSGLMSKLGAKSRTEAVAIGRARGLLRQ